MNRRAPFIERRLSRSPQQLRAAWVEAVGLGLTVAGHAQAAACGDPPPDAGQTLSRLVVALRDLEPLSFPVATTAARLNAGAFLIVARGIVDARNGPETRTACASVLKAAAEVLDGILAELRTAEAGAWRGHFRDGD